MTAQQDGGRRGDAPPPPPPLEWGACLATKPPLSRWTVEFGGEPYDYWSEDEFGWHLRLPHVPMQCEGRCAGQRNFEPESQLLDVPASSQHHFVITYRCRDCTQFERTFAVQTEGTGSRDRSRAKYQGYGDVSVPFVVQKIGEWPPYGDPVPASVFSLFAPDREMFLQGRRCENQGLGIGAFAYYRRVVERNLQGLVAKLRVVATRLDEPASVHAALDAVEAEQHFSSAVRLLRDAIPTSLFVATQNPMTALYAALSEGVHESDDAECLQRARTVRTVLIALALRMKAAVRDKDAMESAVAGLRKRKPGKKTP